ncbi:MAG TPA: sensor histidine kinase [Ruminococcaceae bacterium]|nr:sensor histidine kinase [Oscillospiraceae bacterium]
MKMLKRFFHRKSIQFTISISFTIVMVLGILLTSVFFARQYVSSMTKSISENNKRIVDQIDMNLNSYLRSMMRISDSMYYRVIKNSDMESDNIRSQMEFLYETNMDQLVSIAVFSDDGEVIAAEPFSKLKPSVNVKGQEWYKSAKRRIENLHFSTPHVEDLFATSDDSYQWVVSLSRYVELTSSGSVKHGVLLVDMNFSGIEQICKNSFFTTSGFVYITDESGNIIYHPKQRLIYSGLYHENNLVDAKRLDGTYTEKFEKQQRLVTIKTVGYTGWKIIAVDPFQDIDYMSARFQTYTVIIAVFIIILLVFINILLSSRIAKPIEQLEKYVKEIENGDFCREVEVSGSYEIEHLGKAINSMVKQTRKLMDDIIAEQEAKRRSELDALQAQINPHFLYNTLDSIVWMTENERYKDAVCMVTSLARLFRISLSRGKNIIPVGDELEHVKNYLIIQSFRYSDKIKYSIEAEPQVLNCATIKLIVQPLVENSIYHGIEYMDNGEIDIKAYRRGDDLYIDVIDNGPGMPQEQVDALLSGEKDTSNRDRGSGIGIQNIQERIKLYFGAEYGLVIYSEPDVGTTARIHLPVKPIEDFKDKE